MKSPTFTILCWLSLRIAGLFFIAWAFQSLAFRGADGAVTGAVCLPLSIAAALFILGWSISGRWRTFGLWLALALVGQAVALQLIEAGPALGYQHYAPYYRLLSGINPLLLLFIGLQTVLVLLGLCRWWLAAARWLWHTFRWWQLLLIGLTFWLTSATVSREVPVYIVELIMAAFIQTVNLGNIVLVARALPEEALPALRRRLDNLLGPPTDPVTSEPGKLDRFALVCAVWVVVVAAVLNVFAYERHPHVPDEVSYIVHARYLAEGRLTMPAPEVPAAFEFYLMDVVGDRWVPAPPPGWPAALAVGEIFDLGWLVNPILAGANVLLVYLLLRELYSHRIARLSVLLMSISPWYLFLGMSFMTHIFTLTCALLAALGVAWARRQQRARWAWVGGLGLGMIALIRPLEAVVMAGLLGLWAIGLGGKRLKLTAVAGLVGGAILVGSTVLLYNQTLTGDPTLFPIMAYTNKFFGPNANAMGFGPDRGMGWAIDPNPGHSPVDAVINANLNSFMINIDLFGWSIGSLLFIGVMVFAGKLRRSDYLMLALIAAIFWVHFFYYFSGGPDFGARYWFLMFVPLLALAARGIQLLEEKFSASSRAAGSGTRFLVVVLALCVMTVINFIPWRAVDKYHHFRHTRPDIRYLAEEYDFGSSLVLIRDDDNPDDYASAAVYNPLDLRADAPIYAWDRSPEVRQQVLASYPDRPVWIIDGPSLTGQGYQVVEGPLSAQALLSAATPQ